MSEMISYKVAWYSEYEKMWVEINGYSAEWIVQERAQRFYPHMFYYLDDATGYKAYPTISVRPYIISDEREAEQLDALRRRIDLDETTTQRRPLPKGEPTYLMGLIGPEPYSMPTFRDLDYLDTWTKLAEKNPSWIVFQLEVTEC